MTISLLALLGHFFRPCGSNGIYGQNASGTYEDMLCKGSSQQGVILLSDSTGAHFGIPIYPFACVRFEGGGDLVDP